MNKIVFSGLLSLLSLSSSYAQLEKGINVQLGLASIHSGNLKDYFSLIKKENSDVVTSNAHSNLGGYVGIGGRLVYPLSEKFSLQSELNLSYQSSKIFSNYKSENLDATKTGSKDRVSSVASIHVFNASIPLLVKYKLSEKNYYVLSGFTLNVSPYASLKSSEEEVATSYNSGTLINSDLTKFNKTVKLDKFNPVNVMFSLGFEKKMKRNLKNLSISIRGNYSLTKSEMYSNNQDFLNSSMNNVVFTNTGKTFIGAFTGIKFNDFRMSSYYLTFTYHLVKNEKKDKKEKEAKKNNSNH